jgi:hypothetical protein
VPAVLHEELKKSKEREQHQDSYCENSDSDKKSNVGNTNHSRPLPATSHKEASSVCLNSIFLGPPTLVYL